jgi:hypothetical protein
MQEHLNKKAAVTERAQKLLDRQDRHPSQLPADDPVRLLYDLMQIVSPDRS